MAKFLVVIGFILTASGVGTVENIQGNTTTLEWLIAVALVATGITCLAVAARKFNDY